MKGGYDSRINCVLNVFKTLILVEVEFLFFLKKKIKSLYFIYVLLVSLASSVSSSHGHICPLFFEFCVRGDERTAARGIALLMRVKMPNIAADPPRAPR